MGEILGQRDDAVDPYMVRERSEWLPINREKVKIARRLEREWDARSNIQKLIKYPPCIWYKVDMGVTNLTRSVTLSLRDKRFDLSDRDGLIIYPSPINILHVTDVDCIFDFTYTLTNGASGWSNNHVFITVQYGAEGRLERRKIWDAESGGSGGTDGEVIAKFRYRFPTPTGWPSFLNGIRD